ncbi:hypothetical protein [Hydrogenimonas sp.]|uniref:hypothetical protein n=1 Tax=Hydrogenimonas sp. TaxID=2231112 RepID=UPI0026324EA8|nr:hypothetical protein [Hydrogenimonas sp.]
MAMVALGTAFALLFGSESVLSRHGVKPNGFALGSLTTMPLFGLLENQIKPTLNKIDLPCSQLIKTKIV